jgi:alcohol dehydrogenase class IV
VARILTGDPNAKVADCIGWIEEFCSELQVPGLASYGMGEGEFSSIVSNAISSSSMKGNPIRLTETELATVLKRAL